MRSHLNQPTGVRGQLAYEPLRWWDGQGVKGEG